MPTPATYYTSCSPIINGCFLYSNSNYTGPVPAGYYSDGFKVYQVTGSLGQVTSVTTCPAPTTIAPTPCGDCCFVEGTLISLADGGIKNIKDIQVGDVVLSFNENENIIQSNIVLSVRNKSSKSLIKYSFANGVVTKSTDDHPYYVNGYNISSFNPLVTTEKYGFETEVNQINIGDTVNLADGNTTYIEDIEVLFDEEQVYTFEVENNHNYYANGILVHNKGNVTVCCQNTVTGQFLTRNNAGSATDSGCCCLGPNWVAAPLGDCGGGGGPIP